MKRLICESTPFDATTKVDPKRAKLPLFPTLRDGLSKLGYGGVFTTPGSDRIYVSTKGTWGAKSGDKVAKGFPSDTPMSEIQGYAKRTQVKHGSQNLSKEKGKKEKSKSEHGFATKDKKDTVKNFVQKK